MSIIKANSHQIGQSATATNNLTWYQPSSPDGTVRLGVGNAGATTSDVVTINSSGNLGLGVTPGAWDSGFSIIQTGSNGSAFGGRSAANTAYMLSNTVRSGSAWKYINTAAAAQFQVENGAFYWFTAPSGTAGNAISFTQAMTLSASGHLLLGTTSSAINAVNEGTQFLYVSTGSYLNIGHVTGAGTGYSYEVFSYNNAIIGSISQNGTTGVLYNTSSDQRLKENITDAYGALDSVNAIKVRSFDWKSDGSHVDFGYIAQELLEVVPEAVSVPADPDEMMGVDFGKLTPRLVKAIQELSAQVTTLQAEINALKA